ncbi:MAG: hypothetical protein B6D63_04105 [Candidatus Latescibacteria bacterium 4484_7]|nr:MAG: hypothetical protein B6D63_04105 [Candidatus Latescibacteria bacterium 4484_7]
MGGKSKTYRDIKAQPIYNDDANLYSYELIRMFASVGTIDPVMFTRSMIDASKRYFNTKYLEKLGVAVEIIAEYEEITIEKIFENIYDRIGTTPVKTILYFGAYEDMNGNPVIMRASRLKEYFESNYETETAHSHTFTDSFNFHVFRQGESYQWCERPFCKNIYPNDIHKTLFGSDDASETIDTITYLYHATGSDTGYMIADPIQMDGLTRVLMDEYRHDGAVWQPTHNQAWITIPEDRRTLYAIKYSYRNDGDCYEPTSCSPNPNGWTSELYFEWKENIQPEVHNTHSMIIPIKNNFSFVSTDKYQRIVMSSYGFDIDDFRDNLSDPDIKAAFISYSSDLDEPNPIVKEYGERLYSADFGANTVKISNDYYAMIYDTGKTDDGSEYLTNIEFNGHTFAIPDDQRMYILPLEPINKISFTDRYDFIQRDLCLWGNVENEVHLKWYQTGFFKFVFMVVSVGIAFLTGGTTAAMLAMMGQVIGTIAVSIFGKEVGQIVALAFSLVSPTNIGTTINISTQQILTMIKQHWFDILIGLTNMVAKAIIGEKQKAIAGEYREVVEDTQNMQKQLDEMRGRYLYAPLRAYDDYYAMMYEEPYRFTDSQMYNPLQGLSNMTTIGAFQ